MHSAVPVDLLNPGQVFACLGILELADVLLGEAHGGFEPDQAVQTHFHVHAAGDTDPVAATLDFLAKATVTSVAPRPVGDEQPMTTHNWGVDSETSPTQAYPIAVPASPATMVARLRNAGTMVDIDHWGDTLRDNVKFWAGMSGKPGVAVLATMLDSVRSELPSASRDPFAKSVPTKSSFRFDWRHSYVPIQAGFTLNKHTMLVPRSYPITEILAAIGLSHARPQRLSPGKLDYRYGVLLGTGFPLPMLRASLGCAKLPFPNRIFRIHMDWPGEAGHARCITDVVEET